MYLKKHILDIIELVKYFRNDLLVVSVAQHAN